jgi:hypothetical protein
VAAAVGLFALAPAAALAQTTTQVVEYYTTDAIGSVRAVTKQVNGPWQITHHDFMPFGEEVTPQVPPPGIKSVQRVGVADNASLEASEVGGYMSVGRTPELGSQVGLKGHGLNEISLGDVERLTVADEVSDSPIARACRLNADRAEGQDDTLQRSARL